MKKIILLLLVTVSMIYARSTSFIIENICSSCHGINMDKSCFGVSEKPNELSSSYIKEALTKYRAGKKSDYRNGETMKTQTSSLSDNEIKELSIYIKSLRKKKN